MATPVAFFDIDGTLLGVRSGPLYARWLWREGRVGRADLARMALWHALYRVGLLDPEEAVGRIGRILAGRSVEEVRTSCDLWYEKMVRHHLVPGMVRLIEAHRGAGHALAILSSTTRFLAEPLGREVGIEHLLVTGVEIVDGHLTGQPLRPLCYGDGKIHWAEAFARGCGAALETCWFYTDSITDAPVLERVGHPRVVNPDFLLRRRARQRGWPIVDLSGSAERSL